MLLTLAALIGQETFRESLCSQGTAPKHRVQGRSQIWRWKSVPIFTAPCYQDRADKTLQGGIVFVIHSIEQRSHFWPETTSTTAVILAQRGRINKKFHCPGPATSDVNLKKRIKNLPERISEQKTTCTGKIKICLGADQTTSPVSWPVLLSLGWTGYNGRFTAAVFEFSAT